MKTVAVLEGWAGGPKQSRAFRKELVANGFAIAKNPGAADIIFAHSTGCYFLPKSYHAQLIVLLNPPYWPGQSIIKRWANMSQNESKNLINNYGYSYLFMHLLWATFYLFKKPNYTYSVLRNQSHLNFLDRLGKTPTLFIHNKNDEFCSPDIKSVLNDYKNITFVEVPGYHSDYYTNPQPYMDLLKETLKA